MALKDKLGGERRAGTGSPCSVQVLLDTLPEPESQALKAMLYELGWSYTRIYKALVSEGHVVGKQTINRHRSQACRCYQ